MDAIWSSYYLFFLFCFLERKVGSHENVGRPCSEGLFSWECICSPITSLQVPAYVMTRSEVKSLSRAWLFVTPWTVAYQVPLAMGCSRQEYWSGLPSPSPGDLPDPGIEPGSPALQADALPSEPPGKPHVKCKISSQAGDRSNLSKHWSFYYMGKHKCVILT